ncbi:NifU family protein, partial [Pseudoalteromonas aliena]|uniref:NifU family protein n=1 Tax=Pseudoalteromonas aliena TaxID=247523 RepID=UPI00311F3910
NAKARKIGEYATLYERVQHMLETEVNPQLAKHGGQVSLVEVTAEGIAVLLFGGGCNGCSMIDVTLKDGIEKEMIAKFEEITG